MCKSFPFKGNPFHFRNPYEEAYQKQMSLLERNPDTPNLAKLAYYCGCEVEDLIEEIGRANRGGDDG